MNFPIIHDDIMTSTWYSMVQSLIPYIPWYRKNFSCEKKDYTSSSIEEYGKNDYGHFCHTLYQIDEVNNNVIQSEFWEKFAPLAYAISSLHEKECHTIIRAKLNYTLPIKDAQHMMPHSDIDNNPIRPKYIDSNKSYYSCVYYLSESDGDLILFDNVKVYSNYVIDLKNMVESERISPKSNRGVFIDSRSFHAGSYSTNKDRICCNIVWEGS